MLQKRLKLPIIRRRKRKVVSYVNVDLIVVSTDKEYSENGVEHEGHKVWRLKAFTHSLQRKQLHSSRSAEIPTKHNMHFSIFPN